MSSWKNLDSFRLGVHSVSSPSPGVTVATCVAGPTVSCIIIQVYLPIQAWVSLTPQREIPTTSPAGLSVTSGPCQPLVKMVIFLEVAVYICQELT